jgi:Tol biopolymer transport system component
MLRILGSLGASLVLASCGGATGSSTLPAASIAAASPSEATSPEPSIDAEGPLGPIAFVRGDPEVEDPITYSVNPDGSGERQLFFDGQSGFPRWSPDGTEIHIQCCDDGMAAHFVDTTTGELRTLPGPDPKLEAFCGGAWSPDGEWIACEAFGVDDPSLNGIYSIRASDGGGLRRITSNPDGDDIPADYSPDGMQLLFWRSNLEGSSGLFVINLDGSGLLQVSPPDVQVDTVAAWSPDGSQIVFETSASEELHGELWIVNADGSSPHELAITPECGGPFSDASATGCFDPAWSPDGTKIVFARSSADGSQNIYIVNVDGSELVQVTDGGRDHQPDWGTPPTAN